MSKLHKWIFSQYLQESQLYFDKNLCYQRTSSAVEFGAKFFQFMDILEAFVIEIF